MCGRGGGEVAQSVRQEARRRVREVAASRMRSLAEREARLGSLAVDVLTAIAARDRAEQAAAEAVGVLLAEQVAIVEIGERCGLPVREVARLKRLYLDADVRRHLGESQSDDSAPDGDEPS